MATSKKTASQDERVEACGYQVALMAPKEFIEKYPDEARHFDSLITYEEVGVYLPEFREMCS